MRKLMVVLLAMCVTLATSCSCNTGSGKTSRYVPDDAPFYSYNSIVLADDYKSDTSYSFTNISVEYYDKDRILVSVTAEKDDSSEHIVEAYDYQGTSLGSIKADSTIKSIDCMSSDESGIWAVMRDINGRSALYQVDLDNNAVNRRCDINMMGAESAANRIFACSDGFVITFEYLSNSMYQSAVARITADGDLIWKTDVGSDGEDKIFQAGICGDRIYYLMSEGGFSYIDIGTGNVTRSDMADELCSFYSAGGKISNDGCVYLLDGTVIRRLNLADNSESEYLDVNYCDCNMFALADGNLSYVSDNRIVFSDLSFTRNEAPGRCKLTVLDKQENNPYAGRKIIEITSIWGISKLLGQARREFNHREECTFAVITTRYDTDHIEVPDYMGDSLSLADKTVYITDKLNVDIRSGEGPDVIIGLGDVSQMNTPEYLTELGQFVDGNNGIDRNSYFDMTFKAFSNSKGIFQIPLSMCVYGVMTPGENVGGNRKGFTFDEYRNYIKDNCNGKDPISIGNDRENYFRFLFSSMSDHFIPDGNSISIDNQEFKDLVGYMSGFVTEEGISSNTSPSGSQWLVLSDMYDDILNKPCFYKSWDIYGAPSFDGRGPMFADFNTVSISADAADKEGCWRFVSLLLSEDIQAQYSGNSNPVNLNAFDRYAAEVLTDANIYLQNTGNSRVLDNTDIQRYKTMLQKADTVSSMDTEIYKVILEELRPVFAGEKKVEDVTHVITDRCRKVLDERGV